MKGLLLKGKDHIGKVGTDSKVAVAGLLLQEGMRGLCHLVPLTSSRSGSTTAPEGIMVLAPYSEPLAG